MIAVYIRKESELQREAALLMYLPSYTQIEELIEYLKQDGVVVFDDLGRERLCREFMHRLVKNPGGGKNSARVEIIMTEPPTEPRKTRKTRNK